MNTMHAVLLILAVLLFLLRAFFNPPQVSLLALGLAAFAGAFLT